VSKPIALVMTYAHPDEENRLKTQLAELLRMGFEVHTLGFGNKKLEGVNSHFELPKRQNLIGLFRVALIHLFIPVRNRFHSLRVPPKILKELELQSVDLVIAHDLELLPLLLDQKIRPMSFEKAVKHIDLHELHEFRSTVSGPLANFVWKLLEGRLKAYHDWLMSLLRSQDIDLATVVNQSIGNWYVLNNFLSDFTEVLNAAPYLEMPFESRHDDGLKFVYHGKYSENRGLELLISASFGMKPGDTLNLMLTGERSDVEKFQSQTLTKNPNIVFHESVPMSQVSREIAKFDVEIIFFQPIFKNREFTLPNKFFEALQGRLAIVCGPSPELVRFTKQFGNGASTSGWEARDLSRLLFSLDRPAIEAMREASHMAAKKVNTESESTKLFLAWSELLPSAGIRRFRKSPEDFD
jgi:hypothetical protein